MDEVDPFRLSGRPISLRVFFRVVKNRVVILGIRKIDLDCE